MKNNPLPPGDGGFAPSATSGAGGGGAGGGRSGRGYSGIIRLALAVGFVLGVVAGNPPSAPAAQHSDSCVACHSDERFLVRNKKLYDYFQAWTLSIHAQERVTCTECHGGNPKAKTKKAAHGGQAMGAAAKTSPINYRNIPATCAQCHSDIYKHFRESTHFEQLQANGNSKEGPNCVTCHGSVNTAVLTVRTVRATCGKCHNRKTENSPEMPGKAEVVLNNFLSIHRYYRYIATRGKPEEVLSFFKLVDPEIKKLANSWHTFDIDRVQDDTRNLVKIMKIMRNQVREGNRRK